jgi:hypothetical protein
MALSYLQKPLLKPAIYLFVALTFSTLAFLQLDDLQDNMQRQLDQEHAQVESLYQEAKNTIDKIELFKRYNLRFKSLSERGVIGEQTRADWIDKLMVGVNVYGVKHANIRFSERQPMQNQVVSAQVDAQMMHYETINFEGAFQHEVDFIGFMHYLKEKVNELTLVQNCAIEKLSANTDLSDQTLHFQAEGGNIKVSCQFNFVEVTPTKLSSTGQ